MKKGKAFRVQKFDILHIRWQQIKAYLLLKHKGVTTNIRIMLVLKMGQPRPLFVYFQSFQSNSTQFNNKLM